MSLQISPKGFLPSLLSLYIAVLTLTPSLQSTPMLNLQDPAIIHTIYGADKFYKLREKGELSINISPFYQHTKTSSDFCGNKVPAGDIYDLVAKKNGWNMFGLFFNDARPSNQQNAFPRLDAARAAIANLPNVTTPNLYNRNYTVENNYDPDRDIVGSYYTTDGTAGPNTKFLGGVFVDNYEKKGIRLQLNYDFTCGIGFAVKGGVVDYRQKPVFKLDKAFLGEAGAETTPPTAATDNGAKIIFDSLMSPNARNGIAQELGLNLNEQCATDLEDTHVSVYWHFPIKITCQKGICRLIPYVSLGAWLPTGREINPNAPFSIATGNNGFTGATIEGSLAFNFPKMLQFSLGAGALVLASRDLKCERIPTSVFQVGMIPWTTSVRKDPGVVWYANVSMKAEEFIKHFSFYCDYIYSHHVKDSIKLLGKKCSPLFLPEVAELRSKWTIQMVNWGMKYNFSNNCAIGFAVQGTIAGQRIYRPTTVLGSIMLLF